MSNKPTQYKVYEYTGDILVYSIIEVDEILAEKDKALGEKDALLNDFREMQRQLAEKCGRLEDAIDKKDKEIDELKAKLENVNELVKAANKFVADLKSSDCSKKDEEIRKLKESVKFFSDTLHREEESAKKCFKDLMDDGLISGWGLTKNFFVMPKYTKERIAKFEKQEAEIAELKAKLEDAKATAYADSVDAGMRERRLKRALYKACANWAKCEIRINNMDAYEASEYLPSAEYKFRKKAEQWSEIETKCLKKAEEYR